MSPITLATPQGHELSDEAMDAIRKVVREELDAQFKKFFAAAERATSAFTVQLPRCPHCQGTTIDGVCIDCNG